MKDANRKAFGLGVRLMVLVLVVSVIDHRRELLTGAAASKLYNFTWDCVLQSVFVGFVSAWVLYRFFPQLAERMRTVLTFSSH